MGASLWLNGLCKKHENLSNMSKLIEIMGYPGKLISGSKSGYRDHHPDNLIVFNSNLVAESTGKRVWYGDIDITKSRELLRKLASEEQDTFLVLREMDGRFENEEKPLIERFVYKVSPDGAEEVGSMYQNFQETFQQK